jgi:hypothetical protein
LSITFSTNPRPKTINYGILCWANTIADKFNSRNDLDAFINLHNSTCNECIIYGGALIQEFNEVEDVQFSNSNAISFLNLMGIEGEYFGEIDADVFFDKLTFAYFTSDELVSANAVTDNFIQVGMQWYGEIAKLIKSTKMKHPVNDLFVNNLLYPYNNINELIFIVDNLCTLNANKVFHLPLFPEEIKVDDVDLFSFEGYTNYIEWCENKKFKQLPMLHYSQDAHNALAELIIKDLKV